jgi:hypothetical protein
VERRPVKARLTFDAAAGWDRICTRRNVTFTALMQALGEQLTQGDQLDVETAVARAHEVDRERRSRR